MCVCPVYFMSLCVLCYVFNVYSCVVCALCVHCVRLSVCLYIHTQLSQHHQVYISADAGVVSNDSRVLQ